MKRILTSLAISATLAASAFALAGSAAVVAKDGADDPAKIEIQKPQVELLGRHGADDPAEIEVQKPQVELVGRGGDDGVQPAQLEPKG